jgi:predicted DNA-binding transcriptional regulator AlpA
MEISALIAFLSSELKMKSPPPQPKSSAPERTPLLYKISSVMALLEISHATVYRMVANGELELVKLSPRASRITSASVTRVLEDRTQKR